MRFIFRESLCWSSGTARIFQNASRIGGIERRALVDLALRILTELGEIVGEAETVHNPLIGRFKQRIVEDRRQRLVPMSFFLCRMTWNIPVSEHSIAVPQSSSRPGMHEDRRSIATLRAPTPADRSVAASAGPPVVEMPPK